MAGLRPTKLQAGIGWNRQLRERGDEAVRQGDSLDSPGHQAIDTVAGERRNAQNEG